jgi:hypothetical protein
LFMSITRVGERPYTELWLPLVRLRPKPFRLFASRLHTAISLPVCNKGIPLIAMGKQLLSGVLATSRVSCVVVANLGVTIEAERDTVLERILTTVGFRDDMVEFDKWSHKGPTYAAGATTGDQRPISNVPREGHRSSTISTDSEKYRARPAYGCCHTTVVTRDGV